MIVSFSVQNFRSIREKVTLDFRATTDKHQEDFFIVEFPKPKLRVLKMAMIYGANASGKTNVLMALTYLRHFVLHEPENKNEKIPNEAFILDDKLTSSFEIDFIHDGVLYSYGIVYQLSESRIVNEALYHYPLGIRALVFERKLSDSLKGVYEYNWRGAELSLEGRKSLQQLIHNKSVIAGIGSIQDSGPIDKVRHWFIDVLDPIVKPHTDLYGYCIVNHLLSKEKDENKKELYLQLLRTADLNITDIFPEQKEFSTDKIPEEIRDEVIDGLKRNSSVSLKEDKIRVLSVSLQHRSKDGSYILDFGRESLGTQRFFSMSGLLIELINGQIIPVDEIESSLHNDLLFHFIAMFLKNSKQGQLIFTSHNTALLNEKEIIRRDCVWITDRKADGSTELTPVSDYPVRKEHSLASLFKKGLIGGKPNLGSINLEDIDEQAQKTEN